MDQSALPASSSSTLADTERRAAYSLAAIYASRMIGLFMILPVFALFADELAGATPLLIGMALGAYGLTQAVFQIPYGLLSDRWGRKPLIIIGLLIFAVGSVVAATAESIAGMILGRALQGSGAIAAVVMALAADLTREEFRLRVMALIGITIGLSFAASLVIGPVLTGWVGVRGLFWVTAVLALAAIALLVWVTPTPPTSRRFRDTSPVAGQFREVLSDLQLLRLDAGIFALHLILTASFVVLPFALRDYVNLEAATHWQVYLPVLLLGIALMVPFIIMAEKRRHLKGVMVGAVALLGVAELGLAWSYTTLWGILLALTVFFTAFNVLEASLPSLIAKLAPPDKKGTAMGIYSSVQFLGAFTGGVAGGGLYGVFGISGVFILCAAVAAVWLLIAATMHEPRYLSSHVLRVGALTEVQAQELTGSLLEINGVEEAVVVPSEQTAYLKVDRSVLDPQALDRVVAAVAPGHGEEPLVGSDSPA